MALRQVDNDLVALDVVRLVAGNMELQYVLLARCQTKLRVDIRLAKFTIAVARQELAAISPGLFVRLDPLDLRLLLVGLLRRIVERALNKREEWVLLGDEVVAERHHKVMSHGLTMDDVGHMVWER